MSRSYTRVRPKENRVYSVIEVGKLYTVCRNTVSNWVRDGLTPSPGVGPHLFRGKELIRFHVARRARAKQSLRHGEFKCLACKAVIIPDASTLEFLFNSTKAGFVFATCTDCEARTSKIVNETECDKLQRAYENNTSLHEAHEVEEPSSAGVGKISQLETASGATVNDRVIHHWQEYAEKYDEKTVDAHLSAIREFESFVDEKPFNRLQTEDVSAFRKCLVERLGAPKPTRLSASTVRHRASHIRKFLQWLRGQAGFKQLSSSLPEYLELPRKFAAKPLSEQRTYASLEEAERMVTGMPSYTLLQRRDRAIVATAFMSGLRAAALIALRQCHVDLDRKQFIQDGIVLGAKAGKSLIIEWFPRTETFQQILVGWTEEVRGLGFRAHDALFPKEKDLVSQKSDRATVNPMKTKSAVNRAFKVASSLVGEDYTPHSAKHTLAALGRQLCPNPVARKAWSLNLGHETDRITETYYGKMSDEERFEILGSMRNARETTSEEKDLMLDYYLHRIHRGTPEFERALRLTMMEQQRPT